MAFQLQEAEAKLITDCGIELGMTSGETILTKETQVVPTQDKNWEQARNRGMAVNTIDSEATEVGDEVIDREDERMHLGDSEDYMDSQESEGSFAKRLGINLVKDTTGSQDEEMRMSKRLKEKEDLKPQDMAIQRKEAQNAFVNKGQNTVPSIVNESNVSLINMANILGVSLGCANEDVESNLDLIKNLGYARINLFMKEGEADKNSEIRKKEMEGMFTDQEWSDDDSSENDNSTLDEIEHMLKQVQSSMKKSNQRRGNLEIFKVTPKNSKKKGKVNKKRK